VLPVRRRSSSPSVLELGKEEASRATLFSASFLCILVVVAMTVFITRQLVSRHGSEEHVCTTKDCILFGSSLLARLYLSADPCSHFYHYVCGNVGNPIFPILVDLSLNWRVSLWFDVNVMNLDREESFIVTLDDPGPVPVFRMAQLLSLGDDAYDGVVQQVVL
ncbi:hypothetical protein MRX96_039314, partial [Rhipicephalus microplus]